MPVVERSGSIFTSDAQVLVNTVNCVGVMGAGIALEMRYRYPEMYRRYVERCEANLVRIGTLDLETSTTPWILNFPTKKHWRYPSRPEYLRAGLATFGNSWQSWEIESIAFPLLGASHGGLAPDVSRRIMLEALNDLPLTVEIWAFDPDCLDDLIPRLRGRFSSMPDEAIARDAGLKPRAVALIRTALESANRAGQLAAIRGFGDVTLEKIFQYAMSLDDARVVGQQAELPLDLSASWQPDP